MYVCGRAPRGMCKGQRTVGGSLAFPTPCVPRDRPQFHEPWPQELLPAKPPKGQPVQKTSGHLFPGKGVVKLLASLQRPQ